MKVTEFAAITNHHRQRNTVKHAERLAKKIAEEGDKGRLDEVAVAIYPDNTLEKLNGHSRLYAQEHFNLALPELLTVIWYKVEDKADSYNLYLTFDNRFVAKDTTDLVFGTTAHANFTAVSKDFKDGCGVYAIRLAYGYRKHTRNFNIEEATEYFLPAIRVLDDILKGTKRHRSWLIATMLLIAIRYGHIEALAFADMVLSVKGEHGRYLDNLVRIAKDNHAAGEVSTRIYLEHCILVFERWYSLASLSNMKPLEGAHMATWRE
jgi:hypothetical protein